MSSKDLRVKAFGSDATAVDRERERDASRARPARSTKRGAAGSEGRARHATSPPPAPEGRNAAPSRVGERRELGEGGEDDGGVGGVAERLERAAEVGGRRGRRRRASRRVDGRRRRRRARSREGAPARAARGAREGVDAGAQLARARARPAPEGARARGRGGKLDRRGARPRSPVGRRSAGASVDALAATSTPLPRPARARCASRDAAEDARPHRARRRRSSPRASGARALRRDHRRRARPEAELRARPGRGARGRRRRPGRRDVDHGVAVDGRDDGRRALEHGVGAREDELARSDDLHGATSSTRMRALARARLDHALHARRSRRIASRTAPASSARASTFTCGPASIVAKAGVPLARRARTAASASSVAAGPVDTPAAMALACIASALASASSPTRDEVLREQRVAELRVEARRLVEPRARVRAALHRRAHALGRADGLAAPRS